MPENALASTESQGRPANRPMRDTDSRLIALLKANAREPVTSLARKLGLAEAGRLRAVVMMAADPKQADRIGAELKRIPEVRALSAVSGAYDMMAIVEAETAARMDAVLDRIGKESGVSRTVSSIILSEKFAR